MAQVVYGPDGLVPVVAQDRRSGQVLMVAHMTPEALRRTLAEGQAWYWSRSRQTLWRKGEQSGHTQTVREVRLDCDGDALLLLVDQEGPACHTGRGSCFFRDAAGRELPAPAFARDVLDELVEVVRSRRLSAPAGSYTAALFAAGRAAIGAKVREEAEELDRAARDEGERRVLEEAADLLYHTLVLLVERGLSLDDVRRELARRRGR
ncbi:MAG: bifunctional phosphoribosyl-AMP cyclohydrolase/phosphoribosyl-ATP diphosphatase HisIE [Armatimonadota bacterium]|nr:bifunctional phosphoribosyl-AMP cyclohydrolase/phosphoribosyl-ATP diphosphatase HisIE [Armatimonadota bacterium]MDR7427729.1 bifunctional phosphoribosyl-AMP cyclohydrolase/phosphoribosyl-ATP diphosphatase HisIE [Armatimonadota bacterium]MDR7464634.1 bifunctional phosphoribosyl-AMP cyclohydrolase/phosphoribosyl-ATP diphosphatase HisIE [Armatimonadota bacterium]MDR7469640.1 bifunctional phosphoribosyl-AMP cyclohydrolase/phosphoribosyl-ATP diphosphatase HisIE [Armatimonadota bacterium]MDR747492